MKWMVALCAFSMLMADEDEQRLEGNRQEEKIQEQKLEEQRLERNRQEAKIQEQKLEDQRREEKIEENRRIERKLDDERWNRAHGHMDIN